MSSVTAFQAMSQTYKANVTTSTQTITITPDGPCNQVCVANHQPTTTGGQPVYFLVSNQPNITVTVPTGSGANASYCLVSVPGTVKVYTIPFQFSPSTPMYIAFISEGTSECYFTPGYGI